MLKYRIIPVTPFDQNCSLIWCDETLKAAVVDPGGDLDRVYAAVQAEGVTLDKILLTHAHIDHAGATADLSEEHSLPIIGPHQGDDFWIQGLPEQGKMFGFKAARVFEPTHWLQDGESVQVGNVTLSVLHCPGHTPGHVVFFDPVSKLAIVGDVLFNGSIGRTDFPGGDHATLISSIKDKLFSLGDDVEFIPGHGPMSTFGYEKKTNPFVRGQWG
ncbi:MBL fold metallo-hydrolase [Ketobacter sp.]|uniref:MBL fold metallo-hydrolase n=1 Tax=Ketobacter sp. TaxID=2083498 RepID=UPI000F1EA9DA|nr:MBL fold metallo-hydrolase [Ketobacter sp.]RLT93790.1 MAG: MBL fold metallo-hydrolase [Ketobacter sp.]